MCRSDNIGDEELRGYWKCLVFPVLSHSILKPNFFLFALHFDFKMLRFLQEQSLNIKFWLRTGQWLLHIPIYYLNWKPKRQYGDFSSTKHILLCQSSEGIPAGSTRFCSWWEEGSASTSLYISSSPFPIQILFSQKWVSNDTD